ncbi:flagellar protein FlgN [Schnuerera ultunensis]|uniref:flagellar protein FlgN n=1 Tax=Schnuerera ultunensis TaxID=45497 RepID=UPI00311DBF70
MTKDQKEEIERENMENLNRIMDEKDSLMKKIDELDLSFITIFSQIKKEHSIEGIDELSLEEYPNLTKLKEVVKEVSSTLMTISLMDDKNTGAMKERLEQTKIELRKLKEGKKAYKGYNPSMNGSMLIDEKK